MHQYTQSKHRFDSCWTALFPNLEDVSPQHSTVNLVYLTKEQLAVKAWPNFVEKVREHRKGISTQILEKKAYSPMVVPRRGIFVAGSKAAILFQFILSAGDAIDQLFNDAVLITYYAISRQSIGEGFRTPDLVCSRVSGTILPDHQLRNTRQSLAILGANLQDCFISNQSNFLGQRNIPVLVRELKCDYFAAGANYSSDALDLVNRYNDGKRMATCTIHQLAGYQYHYRCKFGLISTYAHSWLDNDRVLFISSAYSSTTPGMDSTLNQLYFVICLAVNQLGDGLNLWNPPHLKVKEGKFAPNRLRGGHEIHFRRCMMKQDDLITWQCRSAVVD